MSSDRMTPRSNEKSPKNLDLTAYSEYSVRDSFAQSIPQNSSDGEGGSERRHVSRQQLEEIDAAFGDRDKQILLSIQRYRYLMSSQIQRLHFIDSATSSAALRATTRCLKKLHELGLIDHLARRIGGVRAGSGALVWYITHAGERLLRMRSQSSAPIKRAFSPSPFFLSHTLAVAEIAIQLTEICREGSDSKLVTIQPEPESWRSYSEYGKILSLKPDLFSITMAASEECEYVDSWFLEIDMSTESYAKILQKCERYHAYYRTGLEQEETGVFPLTVWIVPTTERKQKLMEHIRKAFDKQPRLFAVITQNELKELIRNGGDGGALC